VSHSTSEQVPSDSRLAQLRRMAEMGDPYVIDSPELLALVECAEIVQTDYLLLSDDQRMKALHALKELGL